MSKYQNSLFESTDDHIADLAKELKEEGRSDECVSKIVEAAIRSKNIATIIAATLPMQFHAVFVNNGGSISLVKQDEQERITISVTSLKN